jgi:hypothetical protein
MAEHDLKENLAYPAEPTTPLDEEATAALGTLRIAPFMAVACVSLLALCLQAPLAPASKIFAFFGLGVLFIGMLLLAWRRRSALLRMFSLLAHFVVQMLLNVEAMVFPSRRVAAILLMGVVIGGTLCSSGVGLSSSADSISLQPKLRLIDGPRRTRAAGQRAFHSQM